MTPQTTATTYCTVAQALFYFDTRAWADVLLDNNTREATGSLPSDPTFAAILLAASGQVEMYANIGQRYQPADLQALIANGGAGAALLQMIVAKLAYGTAYQRRHPTEPSPEPAVWAYQILEELKTGAAMFPFQEVAAAGVASDDFFRQQDRDTTNLSSNQMRRSTGVRACHHVPGPFGD